MPSGFLKPLDFFLPLILRPHPTLRRYCPMVELSENDQAFFLYPHPKPIIHLRDEIELVNAKSKEDMEFKDKISKTGSGAYINQVDVPIAGIPGNFAIRILETMPTNFRDVYKEENYQMGLGFCCDTRPAVIPDPMPMLDRNDYLSEEEHDSEDINIFEIKVPPIDTLLEEFEKEDQVIQAHRTRIRHIE